MGLDQYAYSVDKQYVTTPVDFSLPDGVEPEEIAYWRKHPNLHGWMEKLYRSKMGLEEKFNLCRVELTDKDLLSLKEDIEDECLPETEGFFFGTSFPEEKETDLCFVEDALKAIKEGKAIYYTSWW